MELIIQVRPEIAAELSERGLTTESSDAAKVIASTIRAGMGKLKQLHSGSDDRELSTFFRVDAKNEQITRSLQQELLACEGVEAAYVKPFDEMP